MLSNPLCYTQIAFKSLVMGTKCNASEWELNGSNRGKAGAAFEHQRDLVFSMVTDMVPKQPSKREY